MSIYTDLHVRSRPLQHCWLHFGNQGLEAILARSIHTRILVYELLPHPAAPELSFSIPYM